MTELLLAYIIIIIYHNRVLRDNPLLIYIHDIMVYITYIISIIVFLCDTMNYSLTKRRKRNYVSVTM